MPVDGVTALRWRQLPEALTYVPVAGGGAAAACRFLVATPADTAVVTSALVNSSRDTSSQVISCPQDRGNIRRVIRGYHSCSVSDYENAVESHGSYALSVVRVLDHSGTVVGAGFLVAPDIVATCAHVVTVAADGGPPAEPVVVDFPMARAAGGPPPRTIARVTQWAPIEEDGSGDVALLRLETAAPPGARVPPMRGGGDLWVTSSACSGSPRT
jgi:hypothetical protein